LVGLNVQGTVSKSYARGAVDGSDDVGGLVGLNEGGTVFESYAAGLVDGSIDVGGLVGRERRGGIVSSSYWDVETTGQSTSSGGVGLSTSDMTGSNARVNMREFDFTNRWETVTNPDDYPALAWQAFPPTPSFTASTKNPTVGEAVTFDASGSSDRDGSILAYEWDFDGDGVTDLTRTEPLVTHSYSNPGTYVVTLTVSDYDGATVMTTKTVIVNTGDGGSLSPDNPFGVSEGNPLSRSAVISRVVQWELNDEIDGTAYTRSEIIGFVVEWNLAS